MIDCTGGTVARRWRAALGGGECQHLSVVVAVVGVGQLLEARRFVRGCSRNREHSDQRSDEWREQ